MRAADPLDGRQAGAEKRPPPAVAADAAGCGARDRAAGFAARPSQAHPRHLGTQRRRQVGLPENHGHRAVHVPVRVSGSGLRGLGTAGLREHFHRHRRRAVDRQRPVDLFVAPAEHEAHAGGRFGPHAGADRRVRVGNRAGHRRGHRRGDPRASARQGVLRRDHDPLRQYQVLRRVGGGHRQRRDDVRRAEHPAAVPAGNGQAGQFVRRGDRPQDRASGGYYPCGEREGRVGSHQYRETAARDRPRQALLGAEARPHPSDGPQGRGVGAELCRAAGEDPRRAAGDSEKGQAGGPAVDRRRQQTDRKYD